jgi:hypothetical protein
VSVVVALKSVFDDKGIRDANKAFERMGNSVKALGATLVSAFAVKQVADFTMSAVNAASALAAEFEGVNQIFGDGAKAVQEYAAQASKLAGVSETEALRAAKNFGGFATAAGLSGKAAADFSVDLVQAAGDLASFADVPVVDALAAIQSGLAGQSEPLRKFQIFLDDTTLKAYATKQGLGDVYSEMTQNEKTILRQASIMEQLGVKQGDFVKYQDTYGNAIKTIQADFADLTAEIGEQLLPTAEALAINFRNYLGQLRDPTLQLGKDFNEVTAAFTVLVDTIVEGFSRIDGAGLSSMIFDLIEGILIGFSEIIFTAGDAADTLSKLFSGDFGGAWKNISTFFTRYNNFVQDTYDKIDDRARRSVAVGAGVNTTSLAGILAASTSTGTSTGGSSTGATGTKKDVETVAERWAKVQKVIKNAQASLAKAEEAYTRTKYEINREYEERVATLRQNAFKEQESLVKQSMARITDAFKSATQTSLGDLFNSTTTREIETSVKKLTDNLTVTVTKETEKTAFASVDTIVQGLRDKLAASKQLLANASALASAGFSQTFIEQVLQTGTETGNALAGAILNAGPEVTTELKSLFTDLETVSETGADALAKSLYDSYGLATRELASQSKAVADQLKVDLEDQNKALATSLADAGYAFGIAIKDIKDTFLSDLAEFDGWFAGLGKTIDALLAKMGQLSGKALTDTQKALTAADSGSVLAGASVTADVAVKQIQNAQGLVVDSMSDVAGTAAYLQARISAANKYINAASSNAAQDASAATKVAEWTQALVDLQGSAASGSAAGTVININVKTDTTQSQAMVGKTIGNIVTKYVTTGGQVLVSGNA